jgi:hypothetical protein
MPSSLWVGRNLRIKVKPYFSVSSQWQLQNSLLLVESCWWISKPTLKLIAAESIVRHQFKLILDVF